MKALLLLTLKIHEDGIWIRRLVQRLEAKNEKKIPIEVRSLEDLLAKPYQVAQLLSNVMGIVNRVSDAASPALFKACLAVLSAAVCRQIPIINGPTTYAMCGNKWAHHVMFDQANLLSPPTAAFWSEEYDKDDYLQESKKEQFQQAATLVKDKQSNDEHMLVKPNAGGFGAGIVRVSPSEPPMPLPTFSDHMTLVQPYVPPRDGKIYRLWFLLGKVQCAVERTLEDPDDEFTNACAGGACSIRRPKLAPWLVPEDVRCELQEQLLPLLKDVHCGSVEFLFNTQGKRLYFDLNLLSTLPVGVEDSSGVWPPNYDPWQELADAVWNVVDP
jgi:glutathione synthase/RimK-type ligase-like ATP-grasp enzyme